MSDLQLVLIFLGAIIIGAVVAYNWWQERRFKEEARAQFQPPEQDALMDQDFHFDTDTVLKDELSNIPAQHFSSTADTDEEIEEEEVTSSGFSYPQHAEETESQVAAPSEHWQSDEEAIPAYSFQDEYITPEQQDIEPRADQFVTDHVTSEQFQSNQTVEQEYSNTDTSENSLDLEEEGYPPLPQDIDGRIDLIAVLYLPKPVSGNKLRDFLLSTTDIDKAILVHGLDAQANWVQISREQDVQEFSKATCAIQLADRSGFISRNALNRFQHEVERVALKLGAQIEWQRDGDAWHYASDLDQFCIQVDKMVGFHLVQSENGPFTGTKFRGLAEASGLQLGEDGAFHHLNEAGQITYSILNANNLPFSADMLRSSVIHGVSFQLDIPRVSSCLESFNQMVLAARQMENSLGAVLVDDNQRPIGETQIEKIRHQLKVIHAKMVTRGIIPGSLIALRLFS